MALIAISPQIVASTVSFAANSTIHASPNGASGALTLTLHSSEPLYHFILTAYGPSRHTQLSGPTLWQPETAQSFDFQLDDPHPAPGQYQLLLSLAFQDSSGHQLHSMVAFSYLVGEGSASEATPSLSLSGDQLHWNASARQLGVRATLVLPPAWLPPTPLSAEQERLQLVTDPKIKAPGNYHYELLGRLDWLEQGRHQSQSLRWELHTGPEGEFRPEGTPAPPPLWRTHNLLIGVVLVGLALLILSGGLRRPLSTPQALWRDHLGGWLLIALATLWLGSFLHPELWLSDSLATGGDTASHLLYASQFQQWLQEGQIGGWMPEVFGGHAAFRYYFPLPFIFIGVLSALLDFAAAFKLVNVAPALLLPAASYWFLGRLHWPVIPRLVGALASLAFLLNNATSIWGGNLLALLAGEFAYSWGMLFTLLFWGALIHALREGGRWWLLAALLEVAVALSHGYALLMAGFGSWLLLLLSPRPKEGVRLLFKVHLLAFLLLGPWLIPLLENMRWTIPNDTSTLLNDPSVLWPRALWPVALPLLLLPLALRMPQARTGLGVLILLALLGLSGFLGGARLGLADIRFYPYAQLLMMTASGAMLGWLLWRYLRHPLAWSLLLFGALVLQLDPLGQKPLDWSLWNFEGYQQKAQWPSYQALAQHTAGPLHAPRVVFEHNPDNTDIGSTRALEALPLFGSRPVLEGLYMESAILSPFIYQLQAEISARPSSPLSRYPSSQGPIEEAIDHLNELYTDTLILRSEARKAQLRGHPAFALLAEEPPFLLLRLRHPTTQLIEPMALPLVADNRHKWLDRAFRRFRTEHPYQQRHLYLPEGASLPEVSAPPASAKVELQEYGPHRLRFTTTAPGTPHLIRVTWSPKWQSRGGETIHLTDPAFMLIIPTSHQVELYYGATPGDGLGLALGVLGLALLLAWAATPAYSPAPLPVDQPVQLRQLLPPLAIMLLIMATAALHNPERSYRDGHQQLRDGNYAAAARDFDVADAGRDGAGRKGEARFWAARCYHLAGDSAAAATRYQSLYEQFPENYWADEALLRHAEILLAEGDRESAAALLERLRAVSPESRWLVEAERLLSQ